MSRIAVYTYRPLVLLSQAFIMLVVMVQIREKTGWWLSWSFLCHAGPATGYWKSGNEGGGVTRSFTDVPKLLQAQTEMRRCGKKELG